MARIFQTGFEMGGPSNAPGIVDATDMFSSVELLESNQYCVYDSVNTAGPWSLWALQLRDVRATVNMGGTATEFYARFHFKWTSVQINNAYGPLFGFRVGGLEQCSIRQDETAGGGTAAIIISRNGTLLGTGPILSYGTWYTIECHVVIHASAGTFEVKLDGTSVINPTPGALNTKGQAGFTYADELVIGPPNHFATQKPTCFFDDIAVNNVAGAQNNSWIGEGATLGMFPNTAGDSTVFLRGGADSGANYTQVDEAPPNDATDFVYSTVIANQELFNLQDLLSGYDTVTGVMGWFRATLDTAGTGKLTLTLKSGGTVNEGTQQTISPTAWKWYRQIYDVDPTDSGVWSVSKINALQSGVTVR